MRCCAVPPTAIQTAKVALQRTCEHMVTENLVIGSTGNVSRPSRRPYGGQHRRCPL